MALLRQIYLFGYWIKTFARIFKIFFQNSLLNGMQITLYNDEKMVFIFPIKIKKTYRLTDSGH